MLGRNSPRRILCFFFFNDTATTEIYTLSLHDALPISVGAHTVRRGERVRPAREAADDATTGIEDVERDALILVLEPVIDRKSTRLNSSHSQISYAVFCLKKKSTVRFTSRTLYSLAQPP